MEDRDWKSSATNKCEVEEEIRRHSGYEHHVYINNEGQFVYQDGWTWYKLINGVWESSPDV